MGTRRARRDRHGQLPKLQGVLANVRQELCGDAVDRGGSRLLWTVSPPVSWEMVNACSAFENREFVSGAVAAMLAVGAVTLLPPGEKPWVVSPLGVVPKARTGNSGSRSSCGPSTATWGTRLSSSRD